MRSWGEELDTYALAAIGRLTEIDDATLLLFLGFRVGEHQHFAVIDFVLEHQQSAVRVDHDGLADLFKLAAIVSAAGCLEAHPVKYASAAARRFVEDFRHTAIFR